jgi:hypothetical protein
MVKKKNHFLTTKQLICLLTKKLLCISNMYSLHAQRFVKKKYVALSF